LLNNVVFVKWRVL